MTEALSAALFHFLWQGAILAAIPALALVSRSPRVRYAAAGIAMFAMPVVFAATFAFSLPDPAKPIPLSTELHPFAAIASFPLRAWAQPFNFEESMRWFVPFWILGVAVLYLRTFASWFAVRRLRRESSFPAPDLWRGRVSELASRLGIHKAIGLHASDLVDVPVVAGFLRPIIFVPAALFAGMPVEQLEYLLIHELAHIRRFDYAVNLLQKAVEGLLFYHPAVWWVSRILRTERENCCDDMVVALSGKPREYAHVLASLEQNRAAPALAASGGNLAKRVLRLLDRQPHFATGPAFGVIALAITATVAWAALTPDQSLPPAPVPSPEMPKEAFRRWLKADIAHIVEAEQQRAQAIPAPQRQAVPDAYLRWVNEDVAYIIQDQERAAFMALTTDPERERFIEQFWLRRDPTPGTPQNEMKEEHYRRIAFVNQRFKSATLDGWKTDRGRVYITYGPPDEIDSHPSDYREQWKYRFIQGVGNDVIIEFIDPNHDGTYRMTSDPGPAGNVVPKPNPPRRLFRQGEDSPKPPAQVRFSRQDGSMILALALDPNRNMNVFVRIVTEARRPVSTLEMASVHQASLELPFRLSPGTYRVAIVEKDTDSTDAPQNFELSVDVP